MPTSQLTAHAFKHVFPEPRILPATTRASVAVIVRPSPVLSPCPTVPLEILLIQRAPRLSDPWSAHIAFPGGRRAPSDPTDVATAVRETQEEIGLDLSSSAYAFLGRLHDRPIRRATHRHGVLSAFVFLQIHPPHHQIVLQPIEVASAFWLSFDLLHSHSTLLCTHPLTIPYSTHTCIAAFLSAFRSAFGFSNLTMPALDVLSHSKDIVKAVDAPRAVLWGMTLDILGDFIHNLGLKRLDRPAALPDNRLVSALMCTLAEAKWLLTTLFHTPAPLHNRISSSAVE